MVEEHSSLFNFFFYDYCRIIINVLVFFGLIIFIVILYKAISNKEKKSEFKILFVILVHAMICTLLSVVGYLFNWKIEINNESKLLFESRFLCRIQSIFLIHFLTARENLLLYLTIIVLLYCLEKEIQKEKIFQWGFLILCYVIPILSCISCLIFGGYGEQELICLNNDNDFGTIFGFIHFIYLLIIIIANIILVVIIYFKDNEPENTNEVWLKQKDDLTIEVQDNFKKIKYYPIGQFASLIFAIVYRIGNISTKLGSSIVFAQIVAIGNSIASLTYALIFIITNRESGKGTIDNPIK